MVNDSKKKKHPKCDSDVPAKFKLVSSVGFLNVWTIVKADSRIKSVSKDFLVKIPNFTGFKDSYPQGGQNANIDASDCKRKTNRW